MASPASLTGRYLSGAASMLQRAKPRPLTGKWLAVTGAREHNLQDLEPAHSPRRHDCRDRRERQRQKHPGQRHPLPLSRENHLRLARGARRARRSHRRRADRQGGSHRPVAHRPHAPLQSRHVYPGLLAHPRSVCHAARGARTRLQARPLQLQRHRRPLRGLPGRRPAPHRNELHARRLRAVRGLQRTPLQPGDAGRQIPRPLHRRRSRSHHRRRIAPACRRAAGAPEAANPRRCGPGLRASWPKRHHALRRRGAAHEAGARALQAADGQRRFICSTSPPPACTSTTCASSSKCCTASPTWATR